MKFSLIVPVYNTYNYLEKCLHSLINQKNIKCKYEIFIVNDGTLDNSEEIILKYQNKFPDKVKYYKKKNGGLSSARNFGVEKSSGEYLLFIDSDDYLDEFLLSKLESIIKKNKTPDLIRINTRDVKESGEIIKDIVIPKYDNEIDLIKGIMKENALEVPWAYVYNRKFFIDNNFKYAVGRIHEDYGLTPIIIYKAKSIVQLSYVGYNYVERVGSIISETNYDKLRKRVDDMFALYSNHMDVIKKDSIKGKLLRSYCLEAFLNKLSILNKEDLNKKIKEIKPYIHVGDLYCYNIKKIVKKLALLISIKLYLTLYRKYKN